MFCKILLSISLIIIIWYLHFLIVGLLHNRINVKTFSCFFRSKPSGKATGKQGDRTFYVSPGLHYCTHVNWKCCLWMAQNGLKYTNFNVKISKIFCEQCAKPPLWIRAKAFLQDFTLNSHSDTCEFDAVRTWCLRVENPSNEWHCWWNCCCCYE